MKWQSLRFVFSTKVIFYECCEIPEGEGEMGMIPNFKSEWIITSEFFIIYCRYIVSFFVGPWGGVKNPGHFWKVTE